ncbi:MAG: hypothetical protein LUG93_00125 [Lachnospiraceae bacterium]|nr:hypothetical protein [Lachnospiraceae bacterium]
MYSKQNDCRAMGEIAEAQLKASDVVNIDRMTAGEIRAQLQRGYDDIAAGKVQNAEDAFAKFRESH